MVRLALILTVALAVASAAAAAPPRATVGTGATSLGKVLVDAKGHTLYVFDRGACTGSCAALWPPLLTAGKPAGLHGLGTKRLAGGKLQVTFAGKPLYHYALDTKPGQVFGAAIAHWFALSPQGRKLHAAAGAQPPAMTTPTTDYGDGYGY
jgi:predicted lipoprotein with Yx(FWY)xxD motif